MRSDGYAYVEVYFYNIVPSRPYPWSYNPKNVQHVPLQSSQQIIENFVDPIIRIASLFYDCKPNISGSRPNWLPHESFRTRLPVVFSFEIHAHHYTTGNNKECYYDVYGTVVIIPSVSAFQMLVIHLVLHLLILASIFSDGEPWRGDNHVDPYAQDVLCFRQKPRR